MKRRTRYILAAVAAFALFATVATAVVLVLSPREMATSFTRMSLERSGLDKQLYDHDQGPITTFEGGEGPPLVFVHGLADQGGSWFRMVSDFDDRRVIVVDLPGHGESPSRGGEVLDDAALGRLFEVFDAAATDEPLTLVANSLGGWVAMEYALAHPANVKRLILANSAGIEHDIDPLLLMPTTRDEARRTVSTIFGDATPPMPGFVLDQIIERSGESVIANSWDRQDDADFLDDRLSQLHTPTTLVWGSADLIFDLDYARRLDARLPDSSLSVIDGCGHSPQVGCPDEFSAQVRQALN